MSREDVEVVRRFHERLEGEDLIPWMRGWVDRLGPDFRADAVLAYWAQDPALQDIHPDIEWDAPLGGMSAPARGPREWALWMADWLEMWESYVHLVVEYRDLGDWVLVPLDVWARGRAGVPVEMRAFQILQVRDGKVAVYRSFRTERKALEVAGVSE
jgi:ketosteroid isomerase-like protein